MVQIITGAGVSQISGSSSGSTFSRNKSGAYIRSRTVPVNTRSNKHGQSRSIFATLTEQHSRLLTDNQRTGWSNYAKAIVSKNKIGESVHLTGQLMFVRSNMSRITAGLSTIIEPPVILQLPAMDPSIHFDIYSGNQCLFLHFDPAFDWVSETGAFLSLHIGRPQTPTTNSYPGPWQYADKILGDSVTPPVSPMAYQFANPIAPGQKLFVKFLIGRADGRITSPYYSNAIIQV